MGKLILVLLTFIFLISCSEYKFNFTCNDFSSKLSLEENYKKAKEYLPKQNKMKKTKRGKKTKRRKKTKRGKKTKRKKWILI